MRPRLRLYTGDDDLSYAPTPTLTIPFGELVSIIEEAGRARRMWVRDFADDEVEVPEDLYEVLAEYHRLRPGA